MLAAAAIVVTAVFAALFTWWSLPLDAHGNRIGTANFGQRGIAPIAYALFALALGALVGAIIRRTLPAMAVTLVGFFVARFTFQWVVRPRLVDTVTLTRPLTMFGPPDEQAATAGAWVMSSSTVDGAGHVLPSGAADRVLAEACNLTRTSSEASYLQLRRPTRPPRGGQSPPGQPVLDAADLGVDHLPRTRRRPRPRLPLVGPPPHGVVGSVVGTEPRPATARFRPAPCAAACRAPIPARAPTVCHLAFAAVRGTRCWGDGDPLFERYHDEEWGFPVLDERGLFEKLALETFESGLSWRTILAKRDAFRAAFAGFHPDAVASFGDADVERLLGRPGHRPQPSEDRGDARQRTGHRRPARHRRAARCAGPSARAGPTRAAARDLGRRAGDRSRDRRARAELKRRGFRFVGPTTLYALMQACGLVDDHLAGCPSRHAVEAARRGCRLGPGPIHTLKTAMLGRT